MYRMLKKYNKVAKQKVREFDLHKRKVLRFLKNERSIANQRMVHFNKISKMIIDFNNIDPADFDDEEDDEKAIAYMQELGMMINEILDLYPKFLEKLNEVENDISSTQPSTNFITGHLVSCKGMSLYNEYQNMKLELQTKEIAFEDKLNSYKEVIA